MPIIEPLRIERGLGSTDPSYAIRQTGHIDAAVIPAGGTARLTVPQDGRIALFSSTGDFYVRLGAACAVPTASVTDGGAGELNPALRHVTQGKELHFAAPAACVVTVAYYK